MQQVSGKRAEASAAEYLASQKYSVIDQNWFSRFSEIDIVCTKQKALYFIEVKYRLHRNQGTGLHAVNAHKVHRMKKAAESWLFEHGKTDKQWYLGVISFYDEDFKIDECYIPMVDETATTL